MIGVAWRFDCQANDCTLKRFGKIESLMVTGYADEAADKARAAGWRPCHEVIGGRQTTHWYCPACVTRIEAHRRNARAARGVRP